MDIVITLDTWPSMNLYLLAITATSAMLCCRFCMSYEQDLSSQTSHDGIQCQWHLYAPVSIMPLWRHLLWVSIDFTRRALSYSWVISPFHSEYDHFPSSIPWKLRFSLWSARPRHWMAHMWMDIALGQGVIFSRMQHNLLHQNILILSKPQ